jgi:hypothetical protein
VAISLTQQQQHWGVRTPEFDEAPLEQRALGLETRGGGAPVIALGGGDHIGRRRRRR